MNLIQAQNDLRAIFADDPYTITAGGVTQPCAFQDTDELALPGPNGPQIVQAAVATIVTADFPALKGNDAVTINTLNADGTVASSQNFKVWRRMRVQDGVATELVLRNS
jgi:hypothetical protein